MRREQAWGFCRTSSGLLGPAAHGLQHEGLCCVLPSPGFLHLQNHSSENYHNQQARAGNDRSIPWVLSSAQAGKTSCRHMHGPGSAELLKGQDPDGGEEPRFRCWSAAGVRVWTFSLASPGAEQKGSRRD